MHIEPLIIVGCLKAVHHQREPSFFVRQRVQAPINNNNNNNKLEQQNYQHNRLEHRPCVESCTNLATVTMNIVSLCAGGRAEGRDESASQGVDLSAGGLSEGG